MIKLTHKNIILLVTLILFFTVIIFYWENPKPENIKIKVTPYSKKESYKSDSKTTLQPSPDTMRIHYFVKPGDSLSSILSSFGLSYKTIIKILEADSNALMLDTLEKGDHLELVLESKNNILQQVIFYHNLAERYVYTRVDDGTFTYALKESPSTWHNTVYSSAIEGSFSSSAYRLGLSANLIADVTQLLGEKVDFARDIHEGDYFHILVRKQFVDDQPTGNAQIQGIVLKAGKKTIEAFLANDGHYYDRDGNSLEPAFNRYPVDLQYRRITSPFNLNRKHPVTHRIQPHKGTDFAAPKGSPVYSTSEGCVVALYNHPYAGKYIVIKHNSVYKTRYLHLSRFLVKKGDHVERGQEIALSGATGRVTGPHLHYEVLKHDRAVDAMKVHLPAVKSVSNKDRALFLSKVSEFDHAFSSMKSMNNIEHNNKKYIS